MSDSIPYDSREENLAVEEAALERYARAYIRPQLFQIINRLKGEALGGWKVYSLYAIGGEGILVRAAKGRKRALVKMPRQPYDKPAVFGSREINKLRNELILEAELLDTFKDSILPDLIELAEGPNPLLGNRSPEIKNTEKYLVMEFIPGMRIDLMLQSMIGEYEEAEINYWLAKWMRQMLEFSIQIRNSEQSYYYTDFKPSNIRLTPDRNIRLLDGGSITRVGLKRGVPYTEGYCPKILLRSKIDNAKLEAISLVTLARTMYSSLLNKVLHKGIRLRFKSLELVCGEKWTSWIKDMSRQKYICFEDALDAIPG